MFKHKDQRIGVFVDVQNMYYSSRNLYEKHVNFGEILETSVKGRQLIRAISYVIKADNQEEQKFFGALDKLGFEVRQKDLQTYLSGTKKGDWDVGIAIDAIIMAPKLDVVTLVTGDGDFTPLVNYLRYMGVIVEIVGFGSTTSNRLLEAADDFIDLEQDVDRYLLDRVAKRETNLNGEHLTNQDF
jgi:uncharacterized protein (TIGR00288 family)